nr:unnamed protein product [Digitaria exilis]
MAETLDVTPDDANGSTAVQIEPSCNPDALCHDFDSVDSIYEEVIAELRISKFVTDTTFMGVLVDVEQEVARKMASKDAEIASLKQNLQQLESSSLILHEGRDRRYDEFYSLREQLDTISKSLLSSEWGFLGSHSEGSEDVSKQRSKEKSRNGVAKKICSEEEVFADPKLLKHMDNDALIAYLNKSMNEMKRQHDSVVHEQTEEIFKLKRELLRKEGSNPSHLRNNKELEHMRKKIGEVLSKLDVLLLENKRTFVRGKADTFPGQHDKSNAVDSDVIRLQSGANDNEEPWSIPTQASHFASLESDHKKHIIKLESDIEDASTAVTIREDVEKIVIKEFFSEMEIRLHGYEMELDMKHEVRSVIQNEAIAQAMFDSMLLKCKEEKDCAEEESKQKQKIERLKRIVDSFTEVVREKEEFVSQIGLRAMEAHVGSLCHEIDFLRDKVGKQDSYISEKNREFDIIVGRLCVLKEQCKHLVKEGNLLRKKALRYKEISETRGANLQKAELEVMETLAMIKKHISMAK